jgi:hypothetical protein
MHRPENRMLIHLGFMGGNGNITAYLVAILYIGVADSFKWELHNFRIFCYLAKHSSLINVKWLALVICISEVLPSYFDLQPQ